METTSSTFISVWRAQDRVIQLPLKSSGTYDFDIDWGDGSPISHISGPCDPNARHHYPTGGRYTIRINGIFNGWECMWGRNSYSLLNIKQWGSLKLGNGGGYFAGCGLLQISATDAPDLSETTNLSEMFSYCWSFNSKIGHWDVSGVTNMRKMFQGAMSFNQNISRWNVSRVRDMSQMFSQCAVFNQPLFRWDVSSVKDMYAMFSYTKKFNRFIGKWNVSNVENMSGMFSEAKAFNQDISRWDVSKVTNMHYMFRGAEKFNQPIGAWNVSRVETISYMFSESGAFNQPIADWNLANLQNIDSMFWKAKAFNQDISNWELAITESDLHYMFLGCPINESHKPKKTSKKGPLLTWKECTSDTYAYDEPCLICLSEISEEEWRSFRCKGSTAEHYHAFHLECISEWLGIHRFCPYCSGEPIIPIGMIVGKKDS